MATTAKALQKFSPGKPEDRRTESHFAYSNVHFRSIGVHLGDSRHEEPATKPEQQTLQPRDYGRSQLFEQQH